jgi:hypothetical protein
MGGLSVIIGRFCRQSRTATLLYRRRGGENIGKNNPIRD